MKFQIFRASQAGRRSPLKSEEVKWDETLKCWTIEIPSLEELVALSERECPLIVDILRDGPTITIYDTYVE